MSPDQSLEGNEPTSVGGEIVSGLYKYEGWKYKISGILGLVFGTGLILVAIIITVFAPRVYKLGLFVGAVGLILILLGMFYRKRAKTLSKGKL